MDTTTVTPTATHERITITAKDRAAHTARCSCGLTLTGVSHKDAASSIRRHAVQRNCAR